MHWYRMSVCTRMWLPTLARAGHVPPSLPSLPECAGVRKYLVGPGKVRHWVKKSWSAPESTHKKNKIKKLIILRAHIGSWKSPGAGAPGALWMLLQLQSLAEASLSAQLSAGSQTRPATRPTCETGKKIHFCLGNVWSTSWAALEYIGRSSTAYCY